jgi:NADPH:quinone reductase-like Zn-dependent oxidoreductase
VRAVIQDRYGPPEILRIEDVPTPEPRDDEVLVRVHASTANQTDAHFRGATQPLIRLLTGLRAPRQRIAGRDFAGVVEAVGSRVTRFAVGDRVFGIRSGANADYVTVRETRVIAPMPRGLSFEDAAAIPDGAYQAFTHLRRADVGQGTGSSCTARRGRAEARRSSWPRSSAPTSPGSRAPRTSDWSARSGRTSSSITSRRTSRGTARPTT